MGIFKKKNRENNAIEHSDDKLKIICIDTETTGLDRHNDEILQLSIIDGDGNVLFDKYIKPVKKQFWYEAEKTHHITPIMVADCMPLSYYKNEIERILLSADYIVGYNLRGFDLPMLFNNGIENNVRSGSVVVDIMEAYAFINGEWSDYHYSFKWKKLEECAAHYGYAGTNWHNSLDDARATLFCFYSIYGNPPILPEHGAGIAPSTEPEPVAVPKQKRGFFRTFLCVNLFLFSLVSITVNPVITIIGLFICYRIFTGGKRNK